MSCPNIDSHFTNGIDMFNPETREWFIGKISPLTSFNDLEMYINKFNFKQIHACNTLPVPNGGLSGKELIPYTTKFIQHIKNNYPKVEVIAGGGITEIENINYYIDQGADHVSLGSVCFNPLNLRKLI